MGYTVRVTTRSSRGQATLSLVLLIGGIASAIVIGITLVSITMIGTGFGADAQQRARAAALAGIEDGAMRLTRNGSDAGSYSFASGPITTNVVIYANTPGPGYAAVFSEAVASARRSRLYAVYSVDPVTGIPTQVSLTPQ